MSLGRHIGAAAIGTVRLIALGVLSTELGAH
jgi:hypothetical protein